MRNHLHDRQLSLEVKHFQRKSKEKDQASEAKPGKMRLCGVVKQYIAQNSPVTELWIQCTVLNLDQLSNCFDRGRRSHEVCLVEFAILRSRERQEVLIRGRWSSGCGIFGGRGTKCVRIAGLFVSCHVRRL